MAVAAPLLSHDQNLGAWQPAHTCNCRSISTPSTCLLPHLCPFGPLHSMAPDAQADLCHLLDPDETVAGTGLGCLGLPGARWLYATLLHWAGPGLGFIQCKGTSWHIMALEVGLAFVPHSTKGIPVCRSSEFVKSLRAVVHHKAPEPQCIIHSLAFLSLLQYSPSPPHSPFMCILYQPSLVSPTPTWHPMHLT